MDANCRPDRTHCGHADHHPRQQARRADPRSPLRSAPAAARAALLLPEWEQLQVRDQIGCRRDPKQVSPPADLATDLNRLIRSGRRPSTRLADRS
jgi:hypothetical protein